MPRDCLTPFFRDTQACPGRVNGRKSVGLNMSTRGTWIFADVISCIHALHELYVQFVHYKVLVALRKG